MNEFDQIKALERLYYRYEMIQCGVERYRSTNDIVVKNALFESFLIHTRSIMHFLGWERIDVKSDDLLAQDFVSSKDYTCAGLPSVLKGFIPFVNKRLAHMSKHPPRAEDKDMSAIAHVIKQEIGGFLAKVPQRILRQVVAPLWENPTEIKPLLLSHSVSGATGPIGPSQHQTQPTSASTGLTSGPTGSTGAFWKAEPLKKV